MKVSLAGGKASRKAADSAAEIPEVTRPQGCHRLPPVRPVSAVCRQVLWCPSSSLVPAILRRLVSGDWLRTRPGLTLTSAP